MNGEKPMIESHARRKKRQPIPSGLAGTAPRRRAFGLVFLSFLCLLFCGVCLAAARVSAPHLFMPSTRESAKRKFLLIFRYKMLVFFMNILSANLLLVEKIFTIREGR